MVGLDAFPGRDGRRRGNVCLDVRSLFQLALTLEYINEMMWFVLRGFTSLLVLSFMNVCV